MLTPGSSRAWARPCANSGALLEGSAGICGATCRTPLKVRCARRCWRRSGWSVGCLSKREEQEQDLRHALHEPEVDCISKGKARIRCEFGTKVSLATTLDGGFVVAARSFPGNPYDGHTLAPALEQVALLTNHVPALAVVDRGYRGHGANITKVLISGTRRCITPLVLS